MPGVEFLSEDINTIRRRMVTNRVIRFFSCAAAIMLTMVVLPSTLFAQRVSVQQPVVNRFSVDTAISVPDRGSAFLGGVASAREGRTSYGPMPFSSSPIGRSIGTSYAETHVWIHDFETMDRMLLLEAEQSMARYSTPARNHSSSQILSDRSSHAPAVRSGRSSSSFSVPRTESAAARRARAMQILKNR